MVELLPKWFLRRYSCPELILRIKSLILSGLLKLYLMMKRWLEMRLDLSDAGKRLYKSKTPDEVVKEIAKGEK